MEDASYIIKNLKKIIDERNRLTQIKQEKQKIQIKMPSLNECVKNLKGE